MLDGGGPHVEDGGREVAMLDGGGHVVVVDGHVVVVSGRASE